MKWVTRILLSLGTLLIVGLVPINEQAVKASPTKLVKMNKGPFKNNLPADSALVKATTSGKQGRDLASGTLDECDWRIDDNEVLHIGPGKMSYPFGTYGPWYYYKDQIKSAVFEGNVTGLTVDSLFGNLYNLTEIKNLDLLDTSQAVSMGGMFSGDKKLTSLDVSHFNTSQVTTMASMFSSCSGLTKLDVSSFDTSKVTGISAMFMGCSGLTNIDVSNFDTSSSTTTANMFGDCTGLTSVDVSNFDTSQVDNMYSMFNNCSSLTSLDLSSFDISKLANNDKSNMLNGLTALNTLKLGPTAIISGTGLNEPVAPYLGYLWKLTGNGKNPLYTSASLMQKYDGTQSGTYILVKPTLTVHDSTIAKGSTWGPANNFDSFNGDPSWDDAAAVGVTTTITNPAGQVVSSLDTNVVGQYQVVYTYTDDAGGNHSATALVTVSPAASLSAPTTWDFGEFDKPANNTQPLQKVNGQTDSTDNQLAIVNPNGSWTLNVKYDNFTAGSGQPDLTATQLQFDNLELDDPHGKVANGVVSDTLVLFGGADYAKIAGVTDASADVDTWTLKLGTQLSDVGLKVPNRPHVNGTQPVQYHGVVSWQLVDSVG